MKPTITHTIHTPLEEYANQQKEERRARDEAIQQIEVQFGGKVESIGGVTEKQLQIIKGINEVVSSPMASEPTIIENN